MLLSIFWAGKVESRSPEGWAGRGHWKVKPAWRDWVKLTQVRGESSTASSREAKGKISTDKEQ